MLYASLVLVGFQNTSFFASNTDDHHESLHFSFRPHGLAAPDDDGAFAARPFGHPLALLLETMARFGRTVCPDGRGKN